MACLDDRLIVGLLFSDQHTCVGIFQHELRTLYEKFAFHVLANLLRIGRDRSYDVDMRWLSAGDYLQSLVHILLTSKRTGEFYLAHQCSPKDCRYPVGRPPALSVRKLRKTGCVVPEVIRQRVIAWSNNCVETGRPFVSEITFVPEGVVTQDAKSCINLPCPVGERK